MMVAYRRDNVVIRSLLPEIINNPRHVTVTHKCAFVYCGVFLARSDRSKGVKNYRGPALSIGRSHFTGSIVHLAISCES